MFAQHLWKSEILSKDAGGWPASLLKGTAMQIEKVLINDCLWVWKVSWKFAFQLFIILE